MVSDYLDVAVGYGVKILAALAILIIGTLAARFVDRILKESFTRSKVDPTVAKFLRKGAKYAVYAFAIVTALSALGMNIQPIIAGIGITGFVVGFAVKDTLANLAAGLLLVFYRPFALGDQIKAAGVSGEVREINIVATIVETPEGHVVTLPNSKVWGAPITKYASK